MIRAIVFIVLTLFFFSCHDSDRNSGSDNNSIFGAVKPPEVCTVETQKQFVYDLLHDSYLWADETPVLSADEISIYEDDKSLLSELKNSQDRYSYIISKKTYDDYFQAGVNRGFGFFPSLIEDENSSKLYVNIDFVYPDSPADKAGLIRGDLISFIDNYTIVQVLDDTILLEKYFGSSEENLTMKIILKDERTFTISKEEYDLKTVLHQSVIVQNEKEIGYLMFQSFIGTSIKELEESFASFKAAGIDELILDLRYNGGGYIYVANYLASLIAGENVEGHIFNKTIFNAKYSAENEIDYFEKNLTNALDLSRVFIITTSDSCSASELVINSLRADTNSVEVVQVGSATCGKPYGMIGGAYCDNYILPVQMKSVNEENIGDYIEGIAPQCTSSDDIQKDFGDMREQSLSDTLYYIENEACRRIESRSSVVKKEDVISGFRKIYGLF